MLRFSTGRLRAVLSVVSFMIFLPSLLAAAENGQRPASLRGVVVDARSGEPVSGVVVHAHDFDRSTLTDRDGAFVLGGLSRGSYLFGFHRVGYRAVHRTIRIGDDTRVEIDLERGRDLVEDVVVSATPWTSPTARVAPSVDVVDGEAVRARHGLSLGEAVERIAGVRNIETGEQAGKPMVRGLTNDRIRVLTDGFAHEHQQFSLRHPPNVELYQAERIEVVRGPASVLYGSDALGGVVNLLTPTLLSTEPGRSVLRGEALVAGDDVNDGRSGHASVEGAFGRFGWRGTWTRRLADETSTPTGDLRNTGFDQSAGSLAAGYAFENGATVSARWSQWKNTFGFFLPPFPDFRLELENDLWRVAAELPTPIGRVELAAHSTQNLRRAQPFGRDGITAVDLDLETTTYRAGLRSVLNERSDLWVFVERYEKDNTTRGANPLLPNLDTATWSAGAFHEYRFAGDATKGWTLSTGARYARKELDVLPTVGRESVEGFSSDWSALSGSLGVVYSFAGRGSLGVSVGRGWRAPSEYELFARGQHTGVAAFERGNTELQEETNLSTELSFRWEDTRWRIRAAVFRAVFDDHIYAADTGTFTTGDPPLPIYEYRQTDAVIEGYEAEAAYRVSRFVTLSALADGVDTENDTTGRPLPVTPPDRQQIGARFTIPTGGSWHDAYVEPRATFVGEGEASGPDELFSREDTSGYTLYDLAAGIGVRTGPGDLLFDVTVTNLTDKEYVDFLDTYKQFRNLGVRSPGRGVRVSARYRF